MAKNKAGCYVCAGALSMKIKRIHFFFAVFILFNLAANFAHPVTPALIVERELDSSMFGIALAAMMTMNFLFSPFWGKLSNRIPIRNILLVSGLGYAVGQVFFFLAQNEWMIVFGRMFAGVFVGGAYTSFSNYIINTAPDAGARDRNLTAFVTIQSVSSACGYFIGGLLGVVSTEFSILWQIGCLGLSGILFYLVCADEGKQKTHIVQPLSWKEANPFGAFVTVKEYMTPLLGLIFLVVAISAIGQNSYEQCFNYYIKDQYGMSSAYNGTFKGLIALVTLVLNSTVCITLQKKTDINKTFLFILEACTGLIIPVLLFRNQTVFIMIYILYSSVNVIRLPLLQSMIAMRAGVESRNSLMGFYQSMSSLGGIFGALFAGVIYSRGPMLPFWLAFITFGLSAVVGRIYVIRYKKG